MSEPESVEKIAERVIDECEGHNRGGMIDVIASKLRKERERAEKAEEELNHYKRFSHPLANCDYAVKMNLEARLKEAEALLKRSKAYHDSRMDKLSDEIQAYLRREE